MASLKGWLAAAHPFPLALVLVLTALVGVASADGEPDAARLALLLVAMALSQFAIGWSNDYLDRKTDAAQQPWKPIPSGLVNAGAMPPAILAALGGSMVFGVLLGWLPLLLLVAGTACGLAYNLWLKDTPLSALPFVVALGLLPAYVWASLDVYERDFLWLYALGVPLALAAHVANSVPDIEADAAAGRRGLAARLGRRSSLLVILACVVVAGVTSGVLMGGRALPAFVAFFVLAGLARLSYCRHDRTGDVWAFRLVAIAGVTLAAGWLAAA